MRNIRQLWTAGKWSGGTKCNHCVLQVNDIDKIMYTSENILYKNDCMMRARVKTVLNSYLPK